VFQAVNERYKNEGIEALTLEKIAKRAGISNGRLLYHFPTKDTILLHHKDDVLDMEKCKQFSKSFCDCLEQKHFDKIPFQRARSLFSPEKKRVNILFLLVHLVGKLRELPIKIDESECNKCGKCERECPAGAIQLNDTATIDFSKCLHCYHCVNACPFHAIMSPTHKIDQMIKVNKRIVGMENPSNNIYV